MFIQQHLRVPFPKASFFLKKAFPPSPVILQL